ncbi:MAG: glycosyltransferase [Bacteroidales bacterium]|nr:glycosyltransferase [Bacteroidales bacterium]
MGDVISGILGHINYIILGIFFTTLVIQLFFYFFIYSRIVFYNKKTPPRAKKEPVSVIICAKNEAENLKKFLPSILSQDYKDYEVIVVNDCSTDETDEVISQFLKKYKNLRTTSIPSDNKFSHGKKLAVTVGIKAAKNEILVFTDADCEPVSNKWLSRIQRNFTKKTDIVLGYGGYFPRPTFLNNYIRYDTLFIAMQYFSFALAKIPYMGIGRNLAYRKSLFFQNKGFANHYHLFSGDDDLFVNETANKHNTAIEVAADSFTRSLPKENWGEWFQQKARHFTTGKYYKKNHKFLLGLENISRFIYYSCFLYLILSLNFILFVLPAFGFRLLVQLIFFKKVTKLLNEKYLLLTSLFFDFVGLLINSILYGSIRLRRRRIKWK